MTNRLTKHDWLIEGLRTLTAEGVFGLKAGPMSERLKVSRGSFYWHFTDIADLRAQLLAHWREQATEQVIRRNETDAPPDRFRVLMRRAFIHERELERAVRAWAATDSEVAAAVAGVDTRRIAYIARTLTDAGVARTVALLRARFAYWAFVGQPQVMDTDNPAISQGQIDQISALLSH